MRNGNFAQPKCANRLNGYGCGCSAPVALCGRGPVEFLAFSFKSQSFVECRRGGRRAAAHMNRESDRHLSKTPLQAASSNSCCSLCPDRFVETWIVVSAMDFDLNFVTDSV